MKSSSPFSLFPLLAALILYLLLSSLLSALYFFVDLIAKRGEQRVLAPVTWGQKASRVGEVPWHPRGNVVAPSGNVSLGAAAQPAARAASEKQTTGAGRVAAHLAPAPERSVCRGRSLPSWLSAPYFMGTNCLGQTLQLMAKLGSVKPVSTEIEIQGNEWVTGINSGKLRREEKKREAEFS